ncbi:MAG: hypothetical protein JXR58_12490 [Bacteroidales bacterium]|nr:hypothetical protein [Bacteroidales bacterium]
MKKISIVILLIITLQSFAQKATNDCQPFVTGEFVLKGDPDILIIRSENFQVEWDKKQMTTSWYKIKWLNNCTYTSTMIKTDNPSEAIMKGMPVIVEILETTKDGYKYKISIPEFQVEDFGFIEQVNK